RYYISVTVIDDRHHNQTGSDIFYITETGHGADTRPNQVAENKKIQSHADSGWQDSLYPDTGKTMYFLDDYRIECNQEKMMFHGYLTILIGFIQQAHEQFFQPVGLVAHAFNV